LSSGFLRGLFFTRTSLQRFSGRHSVLRDVLLPTSRYYPNVSFTGLAIVRRWASAAAAPFDGESSDVRSSEPGLSGGSAGPLQPSSVDELTDAAEGDAEQTRGLVGGDVARADDL